MPFNLTDFKGALTGQGARPTLFDVQITSPSYTAGDPVGKINFTCRAAQLPGKTFGVIEVPYFGRKVKVAGDQTFAEWTVTVINDENFTHRKSFEAWMQNVAQYQDHSGITNPTDYMGNATVYQLGRSASTQSSIGTAGNTAKILAQYKFVDIFPTNVAAIDLSYDTSDTIEEFTVEFQVQYYYPEAAGAGA